MMLGGGQVHRTSGKRVRFGLQHSSPLGQRIQRKQWNEFCRFRQHQATKSRNHRITPSQSRVGGGISDPKKGVRHLHQKPEVIYAFIFQHRNEFRVVKMCQVLDVFKSGYYDWLKRAKSKQKERKEQLTQQIRNEHLKSRKIYGSPKITQELRKQGIRVS